MVVYFWKRLPESAVNNCNERIVWYGLNMIHSCVVNDHDEDVKQGCETAAQLISGLDPTKYYPTRANCLSVEYVHLQIFVTP